MNTPVVSSVVIRRARLALGVVVLVWACKDTNEVVTGVPPAKLEIIVGDSQAGVVGKELPTALVARVRDSLDRPISGVTVAFKVTAGGGSVFAGVSTSNDTGVVQDRWTLGTHVADSQRVEVRWVDPGTGQAVVFGKFAAVATAGVPAKLDGTRAFDQFIATTRAESLTAKLTDQYGNVLPGDTVTWVVLTGGGTVSPVLTVSDSGGFVRTSLTMGLPMDTIHVIRATYPGATPATFSATPSLLPGTFALAKGPGVDGQFGTVGATLADSLVVSVKLNDGRAISGVLIHWAPSTGAVVSPADVRTGTNGLAKTQLQLKSSTGSNSGTATIAQGVSGQVSVVFTATGVAGAPAQTVVKAGNNQAAAANVPVFVAPAVTVRDQYGNLITGASVSFVVTAGGGSVGNPTATANGATGASAGSWTLGPSLGTNTLEARVTGAPTIVFTATAYAQLMANRIAAGSSGGCALDQSNALLCWGNDPPNAPFNDSIPASAGGTFLSLSSAGSLSAHACGIAAGDAASCWGNNTSGQVGDGTTISPRSTPTSVIGGITFSAITTTRSTSCGVSSSGAIYCWGGGLFGTLGNGTIVDRVTPATASGSVVFTAVTGGSEHLCALAADSTAYCWGFSSFGQAGIAPNTGSLCTNGQGSCVLTPTAVPGGRHFRAIAAGANHTCALQADSTLYCWGLSTAWGGLDTPTPTLVSTAERFASVAGGRNHTCGIAADARMLCWGSNVNAALGNGTNGGSTLTPTVVSGGHLFTAVAAGDGRTCGIATDGGVWCWGVGPAGGGSPSLVTVPQPVIHH
jgi:alpha-tubulin suppressor-like RCC1 family protein